MTDIELLGRLTVYYGLKRGTDIYKLRLESTMKLRTYSEYQLALLVLKVQCSLTIEQVGDKRFFKDLPKFVQNLLTTLNCHLNQMIKMAGMQRS